jgi:hypothetical protein
LLRDEHVERPSDNANVRDPEVERVVEIERLSVAFAEDRLLSAVESEMQVIGQPLWKTSVSVTDAPCALAMPKFTACV